MKLSLLVIMSLGLASCYKSTIHLSTSAPAQTSALVDNEMHYSALAIFELSKPINLDAACPNESVVIEERVSFVGGILNGVLGTFIPVLQVMNPTVRCN